MSTAEHIPEWDTADRLRKSLRDSGISVGEMAERFGVNRNTVGNWLNGRTEPGLIRSEVNQRNGGGWTMDFRAPVAPVGGVYHLRVRSAGGSVASNSVYVKIVAGPLGCPSSLS